MKSKNEIGLVLKERLKDLSNSPDSMVWTKIEEEIQKKKQQKRLYLFILLGLITITVLYILLQSYVTTTINSSAVDTCDSEIIYTGPIIKNKTKEEINPIKKTIIKKPVPQKNRLKIHLKTTTKVTSNKPLVSAIKLQQNNIQIQVYNQFESLYFYPSKEKKVTKETFKEKLSLTLNGGINYLTSYSEGNSLNSSLINNKTSERLSFNIGVFLNYKLIDKLYFRIGAQHLKLNYTTNNIRINGPGTQLYSISNIIGIESDYSAMDISTLFNGHDFIQLTESTTYIEIPIEFTYIFYENKKYDVGLILGYSQLFLDKTEISGASNNTSEFLIGNSKDVNNTNFSLNLGITNRIKLQKNLILNLELNCKNYFGTYTTNSINLSPFIINFQTGITYDF